MKELVLEIIRTWDFWNLLVGVLGLLLGSVAIYVAFVQLGRIQTAADASRLAAEQARDDIIAATSLLGIAELCDLASDLLLLVQAQRFEQAQLRSTDLRNEIAVFRGTAAGSSLTSAPKWQDIITRVRGVCMSLAEMAQPVVAFEEDDIPRSQASIGDQIAVAQAIESVLEDLNRLKARSQAKAAGV